MDLRPAPAPAAPAAPDELALRRFAHELNAQLGIVLTAVSLQQEQIDALAAALQAKAEAMAHAEQPGQAVRPVQAAHAAPDTVTPMLEDLQEGAALARASLQRCLALVARTLRRDTPAAELPDTPQPLAEIARHALAQQSQQMPGIRVALQLALPSHWQGDSLGWHQIFTNLVGNSLLHGFVGRSQGAIHIEGREDTHGLRSIDYRDDGAGVDAASMSRLFESGFSTRLGSGGNGLGLAIVRQLVQHLGGDIQCLPAPAGAHFRMVFAAPTEAAVAPAFPVSTAT